MKIWSGEPKLHIVVLQLQSEELWTHKWRNEAPEWRTTDLQVENKSSRMENNRLASGELMWFPIVVFATVTAGAGPGR